MQIAEGVGTNTKFFAQALFHQRDEIIAKRASSRQLHVAVRIGFNVFRELCSDRLPIAVVDPFGYSHDAAAVLRVDPIYVGCELVEVKRDFGHVDQVRTVAIPSARHHACRGQKTSMPAHNDVELDARQRCIVELVSH